MKTKELTNALSAENLREINGGAHVGAVDFHIHCTQPEPGTCTCSPAEPSLLDKLINR